MRSHREVSNAIVKSCCLVTSGKIWPFRFRKGSFTGAKVRAQQVPKGGAQQGPMGSAQQGHKGKAQQGPKGKVPRKPQVKGRPRAQEQGPTRPKGRTQKNAFLVVIPFMTATRHNHSFVCSWLSFHCSFFIVSSFNPLVRSRVSSLQVYKRLSADYTMPSVNKYMSHIYTVET